MHDYRLLPSINVQAPLRIASLFAERAVPRPRMHMLTFSACCPLVVRSSLLASRFALSARSMQHVHHREQLDALKAQYKVMLEIAQQIQDLSKSRGKEPAVLWLPPPEYYKVKTKKEVQEKRRRSRERLDIYLESLAAIDTNEKLALGRVTKCSEAFARRSFFGKVRADAPGFFLVR